MLTHLPRPHAVWFKHSFTSEERRQSGATFQRRSFELQRHHAVIGISTDQVTLVIRQKAAQQMIFIFNFTFQVHVFSCSFQIAKWQEVGDKYAFNVMQVKLLSACSRRLQLYKVNESNDVYKNMWSCCSK